MANDFEFSHISVSSDDEEVVIQAGVVDSPREDIAPKEGQGAYTELAAEVTQSAVSERVDAGRDAADGSMGPRDELLSEAGLEMDDISEEARKEYEQHMRQSAARQEAARMVTTQEDLHTTMPFAHMQRIVFGVFTLLIVIAAVYWFVKHPIG